MKEALKLALEALEKCRYRALADKIVDPAIEAIKEALAQPEPNKNRPLESDYTSQVAYTRALERYCDSLAQPDYRAVKTYHEGKPVYVSQEPVERMRFHSDMSISFAPPKEQQSCDKRPWVGLGLTVVEIMREWHSANDSVVDFARAIEAKLKEKNT